MFSFFPTLHYNLTHINITGDGLMIRRMPWMILAILLPVSSPFAQTSVEQVDTTALALLRDEGMNRSQVMQTLSYLTDVYGPRLTWSPEYTQAAAWASTKLKEWGLQNVHFDNFGPTGKGWTLRKFEANAVEPRSFPLIAYPKAWTPGTKGRVRGDVVYLNVKTEEELAKFKGKLKNAFVLMSEPRPLRAHFTPEGTRLADSSLLALSNSATPGAGGRRQQMRDSSMLAQFLAQAQFSARKLDFCMKEGAAALLDAGRGDGGTIFIAQASVPFAPKSLSDLFGPRASAYSPNAPTILPQISVSGEHYNRMIRMLEKGQKVKLEMNLEVEFTKADSGFNVIGEIPGTDLKDEVVMIGAHFDSWHAGTGATDNGTGSSVCLEAIRILKASGLKPRRTIRIGLWGGEEQGLFGSREYVKEVLAEQQSGDMMSSMMGGGAPPQVSKKPAYEKFSGYFNNDNGTGKVRGVYLQGNEGVRPIFRQWLTAIGDRTAQTLSLSNTGGTDHLAFDGVGLPGFQFIQDPIEYDSRTHHSNMDVYDRVQEDDVKQASVMMAIFAYNAAMRDEKLPRKPAPPGRGPQGTSGGSN